MLYILVHFKLSAIKDCVIKNNMLLMHTFVVHPIKIITTSQNDAETSFDKTLTPTACVISAI